jgi:hypothetical protein
MFSIKEKRLIAYAVERMLLELKHPEMPSEKPRFRLHIDGKEAWSWADIEPNWVFDDGIKDVSVNPWNEIARVVIDEEKYHDKSGK